MVNFGASKLGVRGGAWAPGAPPGSASASGRVIFTHSVLVAFETVDIIAVLDLLKSDKFHTKKLLLKVILNFFTHSREFLN